MYGMKRLIISTYQSVTGTGVSAVQQMNNERDGIDAEMAYPYPIDKNCLPHCDVFQENGYTKEEMKLVNETRKILNDDSIGITATAVRVPVVGGHSESINVTFEKPFSLTDIRKKYQNTPGIKLQDNPDVNQYPMPRFAEGKDDVFVGRLRVDESFENTLNMWVVADNLRKGAALNAIQIGEYLVENKLFK
jgi:aspartate-semialdehyde dehydrogenase